MSNALKKYYDDKYDTGDYNSLYFINFIKEKNNCFSFPAHYGLCASYIKDILKIDVVEKILEVGCGTGMLLWEMQSRGYQDIIGIDISDKAKELSVVPNISFQGEAENLNFEDKIFDLLTSIGTYEHVAEDNLEMSLKELIRVSKKAVLWIDMDKRNSDHVDHVFNEDENWWANKIVELTDVDSVFIDKKMRGGSNTNPILINFDLNEDFIDRGVIAIKKRGE